jgi:D-alanine transaminase
LDSAVQNPKSKIGEMATIVSYNGAFMDKAQVAISPDDRGFLFADGVYEVIRSYDGVLFCWADHLDRLEYGLSGLRMPAMDRDELQRIAGHLLQENGLQQGHATVYIQITRGSAPRSHRFPTEATPLTRYLEAKRITPGGDVQANGGAAILVPDERWARCDLKTIGLLPNTLAYQKACELGALEALFVHDDAILEGSHSNVFFVQGNTLLTAPVSNSILTGITRIVVLELAGDLKIPVTLEPRLEEDLPRCQEVFLTATTLEIAPIICIGSRQVGDGVPGPVTRRLQECFQQLKKSSIFARKLGCHFR